MPQAQPRRSRTWLKVLLLMMFLFAGPALILYAIWKGISQETAQVEQGTILRVHLAGGMSEEPADPLFARFSGGGGLSIWGLREGLEKAAEDPNVEGALLLIEPVALGWGQLEEIGQMLTRFRERSGKPVHAWLRGDLIGEAEYFLALHADRIWLPPGAGLMINGLASEVTFWRGTLEKLHIEPEIVMFKEYKSAGEPYRNKEMSPYMREALEAVLGDIQAMFVEKVAERRKLDEAAVLAWLGRGVGTAADFQAAGFVDELGYLDQVADVLKGIAGTTQLNAVDVEDYVGEVSPGAPPASVAVIFGEGTIITGGEDEGLFGGGEGFFSGPTVAHHISEAIDDKDIRAIVLRVNSPGGSPVGSDLVWREIQRAHEAQKPVIISMSSLAASGGYWVSMGADAIVAQRSTITGSIGVLFTKFNVKGLTEWMGAHVDVVATAPNASMFSLNTPLSAEAMLQVEGWMGATYEQFTTKVAQGRNLPIEQVQEIARGRIWSGEDGVEHKLVDQLGGLEEAVRLAREKASLPADAQARAYPTSKPFFLRLLSGDLDVAARWEPSPQGLLDVLTELAQPQVKAEIPEIRIF